VRTPQPESGRASILVAEDEETVRRSLCDLLDDFGFEVVGEVANGSDAVALSAQVQPDIALMDLRMPILDGIGAARLIHEFDPSIHVVILTAYEDPSLRLEAAEAGVYRYLIKGCGTRLLRDVLRQAWASRTAMGYRRQGFGAAGLSLS